MQVRGIRGIGRYSIKLTQTDPCTDNMPVIIHHVHRSSQTQKLNDHHTENICYLSTEKQKVEHFLPVDAGETADGNAYFMRLDSTIKYRIRIQWSDATQSRVKTHIGFYTYPQNGGVTKQWYFLSGDTLNADANFQRVERNRGIYNPEIARTGFTYQMSPSTNASIWTILRVVPEVKINSPITYSLTVEKVVEKDLELSAKQKRY